MFLQVYCENIVDGANLRFKFGNDPFEDFICPLGNAQTLTIYILFFSFDM